MNSRGPTDRPDSLTEAALALMDELDIDTLLGKLADTARKRVPSGLAAVCILDEKREKIQYFKSSGFSVGVIMPEGKGLLRVILEHTQPLRFTDPSGHPQSAGVPEWHPRLRNLLSVPILRADEVNGALLVANKDRGRAYTKRDETYLLSLAAKISVAVENSRLHNNLKKAHQELLRMGKVKDDLSYYLLHDIKNSLSGIIINLRFLTTHLKGKVDEDEVAALSDCLTSTDQTQQMIQDLLDTIKLEEGQFQISYDRFNPREALESQIQAFRGVMHEKRRNLAFFPPDAFPAAVGDKNLFRRIVSNLLDNALKYTPENGEIRVTVRTGRDNVEFSFTNPGPEIPPEMREKVFERFFRADIMKEGRRGGTGLGLTFCKIAVEAQHGKIWVDTPPGGGCRFSFTLPLPGVRS